MGCRVSFGSREQGSTPLRDFNLNIFTGEIMGLIPLNGGHGMTVLIDLLRQNLPLQRGNIYYREELINTWRAAAPRYNRIGVIQSNSCLVEGLTVADNIFVLRPAFKSWLIRPRLLRQQLQPVLDKFDPNLSAGAYVEDLTHFQRFVVELVKAVVAGCRLIILREVSTFISDLELSRLHDILRYYAGEGLSFLYLGYHYEELTQICDRTALFSNGRIVKILEHERIGAPASFDNIVRRQLERHHDRAGLPPVLEVEELSGGAIDKLTFSVAPGECVVLQDLQNRIFRDLVGLFMGDVPIRAGAIRLGGVPYRPEQNRQIAVIGERPDRSMIFPQLSYLDNLGIILRLRGGWPPVQIQPRGAERDASKLRLLIGFGRRILTDANQPGCQREGVRQVNGQNDQRDAFLLDLLQELPDMNAHFHIRPLKRLYTENYLWILQQDTLVYQVVFLLGQKLARR